jgi:hypothetical protein
MDTGENNQGKKSSFHLYIKFDEKSDTDPK